MFNIISFEVAFALSMYLVWQHIYKIMQKDNAVHRVYCYAR